MLKEFHQRDNRECSQQPSERRRSTTIIHFGRHSDQVHGPPEGIKPRTPALPCSICWAVKSRLSRVYEITKPCLITGALTWQHRHHSSSRAHQGRVDSMAARGEMTEWKNGQVLLSIFSFAYSSVFPSINTHSLQWRRKGDESQSNATGKERERESGRKQSQRYCDTQGFLVSFWNLMNQTWCLHTHTHTHPPNPSWLHGPIHAKMAEREKMLIKPNIYIPSPPNLGHPWSPVWTCHRLSLTRTPPFTNLTMYPWSCINGPGINAGDRNVSSQLSCVFRCYSWIKLGWKYLLNDM